MSENEYGTVLIGLAGAPKSIESVVNYLCDVDDALVVSAEDLMFMSDVPKGLTIVPDLRTFKQKNHLMGLRGFLVWATLPKIKGAATPALVKEVREAASVIREFNSEDCHTVLDMDDHWKRSISALHAAYQLRSVRG